MLIFGLLALSSCAPEKTALDGTLQGKISIGPLCPVERIPPDPNCLPTAETFKAWPLAIFKGEQKVKSFTADAQGNFRIDLPLGEYVIDLEQQRGIGGGNLPQDIIIQSGEITTLNIGLDTGIR